MGTLFVDVISHENLYVLLSSKYQICYGSICLLYIQDSERIRNTPSEFFQLQKQADMHLLVQAKFGLRSLKPWIVFAETTTFDHHLFRVQATFEKG